MYNTKQVMKAGRHSLLAILAASVLTACGGGGSSSPDVTAPVPPSGDSGKVISGAVTKGPVSGASVSFYNVTATGAKSGTAIATATTDANGGFSVTIPSETGAVLVESLGGAYLDESDQEPDAALKRKIQLSSTQGLLSYLPAGSTSVAITPLTMSIVERAKIMAAPGGDFADRFAEGRATISQQIGFDVFTTLPANPIAPASDATEAQKQYALVLGGLANAINNAAIQAGFAAPTFDVLMAITNDLVDGTLDGKKFADDVVISNSGTSETPITLSKTINLTNEINRFKNNNATSYSSVTVPNVAGVSLPNTAPVASAGSDATALQSSAVSLDAGASTDAESGLTYSWTQVSGTTVSLSSPSTATTDFTAPSRLVGNETLSFKVVVQDALGLNAEDTVDVSVTGQIPSTFVLIDFDEFGSEIGEEVDGGGEVKLNADSTGTLLTDLGVVSLVYTVTGDELRLDFPTGFEFGSFDYSEDTNADGIIENYKGLETTSSFTLTLTQASSGPTELAVDGSNHILTVGSVLFSTHEVGVTSYTAVGHSLTKADDPYVFDFLLEAANPANNKSFAIADGDRRILMANSKTKIASLNEDNKLYKEIFKFNEAGTGNTESSNIDFTWQLETDKLLKITFDNGDTAEYAFIGTRDSGDIIATTYTPVTAFAEMKGDTLYEVRLSFKKDTSDTIPADRAAFAGIYSGLQGRDDLDFNAPIHSRLHPDGTGSVEFFISFNGAPPQLVTSSNGVCWDISGDKIRLKRARTIGLIVPGSRESTTDFCSALLDKDVAFEYTLEIMDIKNDNYKFFSTYSENGCGVGEAGNCPESAQIIKSIGISGTDKVAFTAVPPLAIGEGSGTQDVSPITINLVSNDIARGNPIDPSSLVIVHQPTNGQVTIDGTDGTVTYTPNAGGGPDFLIYRVKDTAGNLSTISYWSIGSGLPIAAAQANQTAIQGATITLDGSNSSDNSAIVSYLWEQIDGPGVEINNLNSSVATFEAPGLGGITESATLRFRLMIRDDAGLTATTDIVVTVEPKTPLNLVGMQDFSTPIQFGRDVADGEFLELNQDGTGQIVDNTGMGSFNWTSSGSQIDLNYPGAGRQISEVINFINIEGDGTEDLKEVRQTVLVTSMALTIVEDGARVDKYSRTLAINQTNFNVTDNVALPNVTTQTTAAYRVFDLNKLDAIAISPGTTLSLVSNSATAIATIENQPSVSLDELTFVDAATGTAKHKNQAFAWSVGGDNSLVINYADSENGQYFKLEDRNSGTVIATKYTGPNGVRGYTDLMFVKTGIQFETATAAGIYESKSTAFTLAGPIESTDFYYLLPNGTGVGEFAQVDSTTGVITAVAQSSRGICWSVVAGVLQFKRTPSRDQVHVGSSLPSDSTCATLSNEQISFQRENTLFSTTAGGQLQMVTENKNNNCGFNPANAPTPVGCDSSKLDTVSFFPRIHKQILLIGDPVIALPDNIQVDVGVARTFDVLANDVVGSSAIDVTTVEIVGQDADGVVSVNPTTGEITFTANAGFTSGSLSYRVRDASDNISMVSFVLLSLTSV